MQETSNADQGRSRLRSFFALALSLGSVVVFYATREKFVDAFEEFALQIPFLTLVACHPIYAHTGLGVLMLAWVVWLLPDCEITANWWNGWLIVLSLALLGLYVCGMGYPLIGLMRGLG